MYIVSACLLGENVKYSGGNNYSETVCRFLEDKEYCPVCPEVAGGLSVPRTPCERLGDRVVNKLGEDVTLEFLEGARLTEESVLRRYALEDIEGAILKANSPSCGYGTIHDGTFTGPLIERDGVFGERLRALGIRVYNENNITELIGEKI
ncbi:MAG: DUF523 domain-containing protein [Clostridia bacterium]|nr:DUF523 domain-containing protein [Clostridia bacterium]